MKVHPGPPRSCTHLVDHIGINPGAENAPQYIMGDSPRHGTLSHFTFNGTILEVSLPKMSITFTITL